MEVYASAMIGQLTPYAGGLRWPARPERLLSDYTEFSASAVCLPVAGAATGSAHRIKRSTSTNNRQHRNAKEYLHDQRCTLEQPRAKLLALIDQDAQRDVDQCQPKGSQRQE